MNAAEDSLHILPIDVFFLVEEYNAAMWEMSSSSKRQSSQVPMLDVEKCLRREPTLYLPLNMLSCKIILLKHKSGLLWREEGVGGELT